MKLRQKLAVVLASAMVITAVPVVTMAASDNGMLREVLKVSKGEVFGEPTTAGGLQIKFKDAWQGKQEVFYLEVENAEWNQEAMLTSVTTSAGTQVQPTHGEFRSIEFIGKKVMKVTYQPGTKYNEDIATIPLLVTAKGGDAKVTLSKQGSTSTVTDQSWIFATTAEKQLNFTADTANAFYTEGKLATVTFKENFKGSLGGNTAKIKYEIQDADFTFDFSGSRSTVIIDGDDYYEYTLNAADYLEYSYGFAGCTNNATVYVKKDDQGVAIFNLTGVSNPDSIGQIKLKNIPVATSEKEPDEGDLLVDIKNFGTTEALSNAKDDVALAKVIKYSTYIKMTDDKAVTIEAGHTEEIEFTLGEYVDDSIVGDREIELTLVDSNAHFKEAKGTVLYNGSAKATGIVKDQSEYDWDNDGTKEPLVESIRVSPDNQNVLIVKLNPKAQINEVKDFVKIKTKVCVPVDKKDKVEVILKATGRGIEESEKGVETTAISIKNPFNVTSEEMRVKVGLQGQVGGKVVLTETEKAMFNKGDITFEVVDPADGKVVKGITFYNKDNVKYTVEGDIKKADLESVSTTGAAIIKIKRQSKAASTLTLEDFKVSVDRTVPEGKYNLIIKGSAIDSDGHSLTVKDFFVVGTPNTEDIAANGLRRGTAVFTIGSDKYVANGMEYTMDAAAFLQDPGFTMIPLRYVAYAFGVDQKDILFSNSTATIFAGERTIQLTIGSDVAVVNGAQIKMATKVVLKDGRAYAPIGEVSKLLGIDKGWDGATQTATFTNK